MGSVHAVTAAPGPDVVSDPDVQVVAVLLRQLLDELDADAAYVATPAADGETLEVARVTPFSREPVRLTMPADAPYPIAETMRTRQPLFIGSNEELCEHPGLVRVKSEDHACATLPLLAEDGDLLGAVNFGFDEPHRFTSEELELIDVVAEHCARAMSVARRLQDEVRARAAPDEGPVEPS